MYKRKILGLLYLFAVFSFTTATVFAVQNDVFFTNGSQASPGLARIGAEITPNVDIDNIQIGFKDNTVGSTARCIILYANTTVLYNESVSTSGGKTWCTVTPTIQLNTSVKYGVIIYNTTGNIVTQFVASNSLKISGTNLNYTRGSFYSASPTTYQTYSAAQLWGFSNISSNAVSPPPGVAGNFSINVSNVYNSSPINNISAIVNGTAYESTNGLIITPIPNSPSFLVNVSVYSNESGGYQLKQYQNFNSTTNLTAALFQVNVTMNASTKFSNQIVTGWFNSTLTNTTNNTLLLNSGTQDITFFNASFVSKTQSFTYTANTTVSSTIQNVTNTTLNVTAFNFTSNASINTFTAILSYGGVTETQSTTGGSISFAITGGLTYSLSVNASGFTTNTSSVTTNANVSLASIVPPTYFTVTTYSFYNNATLTNYSVIIEQSNNSLPYQPFENISAWYRFDENNQSASDSSGNGNTGTLSGWTFNNANLSTTVLNASAGKYGNGANFDGATKSISFNNTQAITKGTVSLWFNAANNINTNQIILTKVNVGVTQLLGLALNTNGKLQFTLNDAAISSAGTIANNTWYYATATWDGTNQTIYLNAVMNSTAANAGGIAANSTLLYYLGSRNNAAQFFNGTVDEVRIWNVTLNTSQILQEMNSSYPVNGNGLVASYSFESNFTNATGNYTYDTNNLVAGQINGSFNFNGLNTKVSTGITSNSAFNSSSGFTINTWIYPLDYGANGAGRIVDKSEGNNAQNGLGFYVLSTNTRLRFTVNTTAINSAIGSITTNQWQMATIVVNGSGSANFYVNGTLSGTADQSLVSLSKINTTALLVIGQRTGASDRAFNGSIDDVRIYNTSLSATQVQQLFQAGAYRIYNYSTTNRSLQLPLYTSGLYNFTISSTNNGGFFPTTILNQNVSSNINASMVQVIAGISATQKWTGAATTGFASVPLQNNATGSILYLNAGTYQVTFTNSTTGTMTQPFTYAAQTSYASVVNNVTNGSLIITPFSTNVANNFTVQVSYGGITETNYTVAGSVNVTVVTGLNYTINVTIPGYASYVSTVVPTNITTYVSVNATTQQSATIGVYDPNSVLFLNTTQISGGINQTLGFYLLNVTDGNNAVTQLNYTVIVRNYTGSAVLYNVTAQVTSAQQLATNFTLQTYNAYNYTISLLDTVSGIYQNYSGQLQAVAIAPVINATNPYLYSATTQCAIGQSCAIQMTVTDDGCALGGYNGNASITSSTGTTLLTSQNWTYTGQSSYNACVFLSSSFVPNVTDTVSYSVNYTDAQGTRVNTSGSFAIIPTPVGGGGGGSYFPTQTNTTVNVTNITVLPPITSKNETLVDKALSVVGGGKDFVLRQTSRFNPVTLGIFVLVMSVFSIALFYNMDERKK